MIKSIQKLQLEPDIFQPVYQRLMSHPASPDFCRYTFAELKQLSGNINYYLGKFGDSKFHQYQSQFTRFEFSVMEQLLRVSDDKHDRLKRLVATAVEKTSRYLEDLKIVHESEQKLQAEYLALQSKRSSIGKPSMEQRFS
jgi:hypothetical protein